MSEEINNNEMNNNQSNNDTFVCPNCGRIFSKVFPDCVFCDMRYKVVNNNRK